MSKNIYEKYGIIITRFWGFWGGEERGMCYQINVGGEFVQLTKDEFKDFSYDLEAIAVDE